jgi:serine/threonine-protein kinase RsbW
VIENTPRQADPLTSLDRRQLIHRLRVSLPSTRAALRRAVAQVRRIAARCGCSEEQGTDLEIALVEALANAMEHGNRGLPRRRVFLRCYGGPRAGIVILVRDQGPGFDPASVPDPRESGRRELQHGRGLLMMRELMDRIEFRRGGREVLMVRAWSAE